MGGTIITRSHGYCLFRHVMTLTKYSFLNYFKSRYVPIVGNYNQPSYNSRYMVEYLPQPNL